MAIDYKSIVAEARRHAIYKRRPEIADDFAQECCLYALVNNTEYIYIPRRFIDFLRALYGNSRRGVKFGLCLTSWAHSAMDPNTWLEDEKQVKEEFSVKNLDLNALSPHETLVLKLFVENGMLVPEIAALMEVPAAEVTLLLRGMKDKVKILEGN